MEDLQREELIYKLGLRKFYKNNLKGTFLEDIWEGISNKKKDNIIYLHETYLKEYKQGLESNFYITKEKVLEGVLHYSFKGIIIRNIDISNLYYLSYVEYVVEDINRSSVSYLLKFSNILPFIIHLYTKVNTTTVPIGLVERLKGRGIINEK